MSFDVVKIAPSHPTPPPSAGSRGSPHLEGFALGEEGFPERRGGGPPAERGAAQGDLGLPAGDGGGAQRGGLLAPGDGRVAHGYLGLVPLDGGVAQGQGGLPFGDAGVAHCRGRGCLPDPGEVLDFGVHATRRIAHSCSTPRSPSPGSLRVTGAAAQTGLEC